MQQRFQNGVCGSAVGHLTHMSKGSGSIPSTIGTRDGLCLLEAIKNESPTRPQDRGFRKVPEPPTNTSDFKDVLSPPAWFLPIQVPPPQVHLAIPLGLLDHP